MLTTPTTWGITGSQFLWGYGAPVAVAAAAILVAWRRLLGPSEPAGDDMPDLGLYELAAVGGGPQLAVTSAVSQLHRDGAIAVGAGEGRLEATREA